MEVTKILAKPGNTRKQNNLYIIYLHKIFFRAHLSTPRKQTLITTSLTSGFQKL